MTESVSKKSIMKMLGIEELISEYEHHCQNMTQKKKNPNPNNLNRNRYASLLDIDTKKQPFHSTSNIHVKPPNLQNSSVKTSTYKNSESNHDKKSTIESQISKHDKSPKTSLKLQYLKPKIISSLVNFNKKAMPSQKQPDYSKKISIRGKDSSHQSIKQSMETPNKVNSKGQSSKYSSYLSLKARNSQKPNYQASKGSVSPEHELIDFQNNPTLAGINKRIKEFENKQGIVKKDHSPQQMFRKHQKQVTLSQEQRQNDAVRNVRMSETISIEPQMKASQQEFISLDTNYYGFSFKNRIPCNKQSKLSQHHPHPYKKQSLQQQISSTLDKSTHQTLIPPPSTQSFLQPPLHPQSKSTPKLPPSTGRRTYNTLNTQKKPHPRYNNSTNILQKKKPNSSLILKPKTLLKDRYQIMKVIGKGMSGEVFQAKDVLADRFVAIKEVDEKSAEYDFFREIEHNNVIRYYNNFVEMGKRYLVLEYFPMTLKDLVKQGKKHVDLEEEQVRHIFKSIFNGLSYLHSLSIAHRDIKLDNIVISEDLKDVKFIDFGLCIDLSKTEEGLSKDFCGTLSYLPPQIIQGQPHEPKKADIWSLGIVLYAISVGRLPYKGRNENDVLSKILKGKPIYPEGFSSKLKNLIELMLQKNPAKRCTVNDILSHEWLH